MLDPLDESRLCQELVTKGLLTEAQVKTSLEYQASLGGNLSDIMLKLGFVEEGDLNRVIAQREHMRSIDLAGRNIDRELMGRIPRKVIEKYEAVPLQHTDDTIMLAMSRPMDFQAVEDFQFLTSCKIETVLAPRSQILELIARYYDQEMELAGAREEPPLEERLVARIADPAVAALARLLLRNGLITAEEWQAELE